MKRLLSFILSFLVIVTINTTSRASSDKMNKVIFADNNYKYISSDLDGSLSVEYYKNLITSKSDFESSETKTFLNEFNRLTKDEQELFVKYLNDTDLLIDVLNLASSNEEHAELANGDIVISNTETFEANAKDKNLEYATKAAIQTRTGTATRSVSILGVKVFEYSAEIRYTHNGVSIQQIPYANIRVSRNFIPFVDFSWSNQKTYGVGTRVAHHLRNCTWSFVHPKLGLTYGTQQVEITGNTNNQTTFSVR